MDITINKLWAWACSGNTEKLQEYYNNGGKTNLRYTAFGEQHSLIAGAWRNGQTTTVKYLLSIGETLTESEKTGGIDVNKMWESVLGIESEENFQMTFNELLELSGMGMKRFGEYFEIPYTTIQGWKYERNKCADYLIKLMLYKLQHENKLNRKI